jgi:nicotinate-nucleotide adenylyltransferase
MKIGVFGGTFNPPHIAHLILADETRHQLGLDRLLWVLTPNPPHKQERDFLPFQARLDMLSAALASDPDFEISQADINRPPPHYAVDTMHLLRAAHPEAELIYLMGGDSLRDLPLWYKPRDFLAACDALAVMRRPGDQVDLPAIELHIPGISNKVSFIDAPLLEISATTLRGRIARGESYRYYLPPSVYDIIQERGLYSQIQS